MLVPLHPFAQYVRANPALVLSPVAFSAVAGDGHDVDDHHDRASDDEDDDASQDDFFANNAPCTD